MSDGVDKPKMCSDCEARFDPDRWELTQTGGSIGHPSALYECPNCSNTEIVGF